MSITFESLTAVLPTLDETHSLTHTVDCLVGDLRDDLAEILIIVCERTSEAALEHANAAVEKYPDIVSIHWQEKPFFGGAILKAFDVSVGSHTILMAPDLETKPEDEPLLVAAAKADPDAAITASRWGGGGFEGYSEVKLLSRWIFLKIFAVLSRVAPTATLPPGLGRTRTLTGHHTPTAGRAKIIRGDDPSSLRLLAHALGIVLVGLTPEGTEENPHAMRPRQRPPTRMVMVSRRRLSS